MAMASGAEASAEEASRGAPGPPAGLRTAASQRRRAAALAAALLLASGAAQAQSEAAAPAANPGRDAFLQYCASCHGERADGKGPMAGELRKAPADLRRLERHFGSPLNTPRLLERIDGRRMARAHGSRDMPVWGRKLAANVPRTQSTETQTRGTMLIIIEWLASIQQPES